MDGEVHEEPVPILWSEITSETSHRKGYLGHKQDGTARSDHLNGCGDVAMGTGGEGISVFRWDTAGEVPTVTDGVI